MPDAEQQKTRAERRQQMVKSSRQIRMQKYQKNKREMFIIKSVSILLALIVIGALGFAGFTYLRDWDLNQAPDNVAVYTYSGSNHIEGDIDYSAQADYQGEVPPAGGAHNGEWQTCDVYDARIRQENAIHSMEHGAVWITYQPTLPADQIANLKDLADGDDYMLMSPYEGLPAPIVVTAWNHQIQLQTFDKTQIERFIRSYQSTLNITPELGGSCVGVTTTMP